MIDLYYWPTPNGHKVPIMLEASRVAAEALVAFDEEDVGSFFLR